jgi:hypothetical protein
MSDPSKVMCPLLTAGLIKQQEIPMTSEGIKDTSNGLEAVACQGAACAFWMAIADEKGHKTKDGNCAIPLTAVAVSQLNVSLNSKSKIVKG